MLKIYYHILISAWKNFKFSTSFFWWLFIFTPFLVFNRITFFLDKLIFPDYRKVAIERPIFIIGNPRSGTTFLHRMLNQTREYAAFEAWHLIFPALSARLFFRPLVNFLIKNNMSQILPDEFGHKIALDEIEEEEFLFFHQLDTQHILQLTPLGLDEREYPELRFHDQQEKTCRLNSINFFKECLQRQIYYTKNKQIIAKMHFSTHRIKTLMEAFPDAKFIYLIRSPYETIPSHLSLAHNIYHLNWNVKKLSPRKMECFIDRRYRYDVDIYSYFYDLQKNREIPEDRIMVLRYDHLCSDPIKAFEEIMAFTQLQPSDELRRAVERQAKSQKEYKRKHIVMEIVRFGLSREKIAEDLRFIFEEY